MTTTTMMTKSDLIIFNLNIRLLKFFYFNLTFRYFCIQKGVDFFARITPSIFGNLFLIFFCHYFFLKEILLRSIISFLFLASFYLCFVNLHFLLPSMDQIPLKFINSGKRKKKEEKISKYGLQTSHFSKII